MKLFELIPDDDLEPLPGDSFVEKCSLQRPSDQERALIHDVGKLFGVQATAAAQPHP